jgi:dTDP-glucose 4,6-dehydratase
MKTALITGGAGFLGSHLCDFLLGRAETKPDEECRVICVDNLLTGRLENVAHLAADERFRFVRHDVTEEWAETGPVDYVLHLASPASPVDFDSYPIEILRVGSVGTENALRVAREHGAVFLLASTSEVYGDPEVHPQPETYVGHVNPIGPRSCYDEAKRYAEAFTVAYRRVHQVDAKIVRIFNTYGPRMRDRDGRVVPAFITQALRGEPLTVFGDGSHTRSLCYVADLVLGIYRLLVSKDTGPINIGNPEEISILDFARRVIAATGSASEIRFLPGSEDDPKLRRPDISRARATLGWEPQVPLDEGLRRTIDWFRSEIK